MNLVKKLALNYPSKEVLLDLGQRWDIVDATIRPLSSFLLQELGPMFHRLPLFIPEEWKSDLSRVGPALILL